MQSVYVCVESNKGDYLIKNNKKRKIKKKISR